MSLLGRAVFSAELMKRFNPKSIRSVALCKKGDSELEAALMAFPGVEVVVVTSDEIASTPSLPQTDHEKESGFGSAITPTVP
jgi:hypothetical protein